MRRSSVLLFLIPVLVGLSCAEQPTSPPAAPSAQADEILVNGTVPIYDIQGAGHSSPYRGMTVTTTGVVTAVGFRSYYIQDPIGDGNENTSDGLFVFDLSTQNVIWQHNSRGAILNPTLAANGTTVFFLENRTIDPHDL